MQIENWFNTTDIKRYYFPGRIFIGAGCFKQAVDLCLQTEGQIAIVADQVVYDLPFVSDQLASLEHRGAYIKLVHGAPIAQEVESFAQKLVVAPAVILSIGGGSATDFAKAVTARLMFGTFDGIGLHGNIGEAKGKDCPIFVSVPTTAGSGAEASRYFVTYDRDDHHKVFGRSWQLVADWIFLDPQLLTTLPNSTIVSCAFDAFVHLFETLIVKHEFSMFGEMFSLNAIPRILSSLERGVVRGERDFKTHEELLYSATLAGVAISNVRTGNIHEAAGALLELTNLSHPETLFVFFRTAIEQYLTEIRGCEKALISQLRLIPEFAKFESLNDVILWWEKLFKMVGLTSRIGKALSSMDVPYDVAKAHIFQRVFADKVWISKESPIHLDENAINSFIDNSFAHFR